MSGRAVHVVLAGEKRGTGMSRNNNVVDAVFVALRPPDDIPDPLPEQVPHELPQYSWGDLLEKIDVLSILEPFIMSRSQLAPLLCLNHGIRMALMRHPPLRYLGLFRTPFGAEHGCRLHPHQLRSLRVMHNAESPPDWEFGQMRGGVLADDPGLGKTVTMLALLAATVGVPPAMPKVFWDSSGWPALRTNQVGLQGLLKLTNFLRSIGSTTDPTLRRLSRFANREGAAADYASLEDFEADVEQVVKATIASLGGPRAPVSAIRAVREPVRLKMLAVREGLDPRQRALNKSKIGKRVQLERNLVGTPATLVVVPTSLLEHWYEQLRRHIDLRVLRRHAGCDGCAVWVDGLGDLEEAHAFVLPPRQRMEQWPALPEEYVLAACTIVLTSYERCEYEYVHRAGADGTPGGASSLMKLRWLRLVVDEGHELGHNDAAGWSDSANQMISMLAAERRWVMSGTPVGAGGQTQQLVQLQRLLSFLREPQFGVVMRDESLYREHHHSREAEAERAFDKRVLKPASSHDARRREQARAELAGVLTPLMVRHRKADLKLPEPIHLPPFVATLAKLPEELTLGFQGQRAYTNRVCEHGAEHVIAVMDAARDSWRRESHRLGAPEPKAVVFSEFDNDLSQARIRRAPPPPRCPPSPVAEQIPSARPAGR